MSIRNIVWRWNQSLINRTIEENWLVLLKEQKRGGASSPQNSDSETYPKAEAVKSSDPAEIQGQGATSPELPLRMPGSSPRDDVSIRSCRLHFALLFCKHLRD